MKHRLLHLLLLLSTISFGQMPAYQSMLENGKVWDVFTVDTSSNTPYKQGFRYLINGGGSFQGQQYQEIWYELFDASNPGVFVPPFVLGLSPVPFGLMREDTIARKVYFRQFQFDWSTGEEHLIYDFNLPIGDSLQMYDNVWYVLDSVGSTTIENGELRRKFYFHSSDQAMHPTFYIEGVGGKNGFAYPMELLEFYDLVCVKRNDVVLYSAGAYDYPCDFTSTTQTLSSEKIRVWPNPVLQELHLELEPGRFTLLTLYDLNGRELGAWELPPNENRIGIPVHNIPNGPYLGVLIGCKAISRFKGLKIRD